jgi:pyridoxamine 5'-phosphate oxidase
VPIPARPLHAHDLDADPFVQFGRWFADADAHGQLQPDAMVVATSTPDGRPSARMVLLRGVDQRGFCFYTNFDSRKGAELTANPHAAIALHWPEVLRQVRATGRVERVADDESDAYWYARPRASRVSAWASAQSQPVTTRDELEARVAEVDARFTGAEVPRPDGWGGFRVVPDAIEFWQHRDDRLHDRFVYTRSGREWQIVRLQP